MIMIKLTAIHGPYTKKREIWINPKDISDIQPSFIESGSSVTFSNGRVAYVAETIVDIINTLEKV